MSLKTPIEILKIMKHANNNMMKYHAQMRKKKKRKKKVQALPIVKLMKKQQQPLQAHTRTGITAKNASIS